MKDYVDLFDHYAIEFCRKLENNAHGDWDKLNEIEQEIAAHWKLLVDMYNGGFLQFFCNWGFAGYWYAMRGLQRIGDTTLLGQLHNTYQAVLEKFQQDQRIKSYWDIPKYLSSEDEAILQETDRLFDEHEGEKFAQMAYNFYFIKMEIAVEQ